MISKSDKKATAVEMISKLIHKLLKANKLLVFSELCSYSFR